MMKFIETHGITYIEPLAGSGGWYWGSDHAAGDLYEAEELYRAYHPVACNRLVLVHAPEGRVVEPVKSRAGLYFGRPISYSGKIQILAADFPGAMLCIFAYDDSAGQVTLTGSLPLAEVEDCYNLMLSASPLMVTRQGNDGKFQIVWPEKLEFAIGERESFLCREDDKLYFSRWYELPESREERDEIVVRRYPGGAILEVILGSWQQMPDGEIWVLR